MTRGARSGSFFVDVGQLAAQLRQAAPVTGQSWSLVSAPMEAAQGNVAWGRAVVDVFYRLLREPEGVASGEDQREAARS